MSDFQKVSQVIAEVEEQHVGSVRVSQIISEVEWQRLTSGPRLTDNDIGYATQNDGNPSGIYNITVPSDCTFLMAVAGAYKNTTNWMPDTPIYINSRGLTLIEKTDDQSDNAQMWMGYLQNPDVGDQIINWDWLTDIVSGTVFHIVFLKEVDEDNPIVSSGKQLVSELGVSGLSGSDDDLMVGSVVTLNSVPTSVNDNGQSTVTITSEHNIGIGTALKTGSSTFDFTGSNNTTAAAAKLKRQIIKISKTERVGAKSTNTQSKGNIITNLNIYASEVVGSTGNLA